MLRSSLCVKVNRFCRRVETPCFIFWFFINFFSYVCSHSRFQQSQHFVLRFFEEILNLGSYFLLQGSSQTLKKTLFNYGGFRARRPHNTCVLFRVISVFQHYWKTKLHLRSRCSPVVCSFSFGFLLSTSLEKKNQFWIFKLTFEQYFSTKLIKGFQK